MLSKFAVMKSELDLFAVKPIQTNVLKTDEISYKPIAPISSSSNGTIEFVSLGNLDTYRNLSSVYLRLLIKVVNPNSAKHTGVVNNILHSLFRQITITMNGKSIAQTDTNYSYRALITNLLNYGNDASSTHLESTGWKLDTGNLDGILPGLNHGLDGRRESFKSDSVIEIMGKIHGDLFNQDRYLLNNVDLRISLSLEKPEFYIMEEDDGNASIQIMDATLYMDHITLNPSVLVAQQMVLQKTEAIYPYTRVEVKTYTVPANSMNISLDNIVIGQLPNLLVFCMVDNDAYTGKRSKNPFNFKHNNMSSFFMSVNGVQVPSQAIEMDFSTDPPQSTRAYNTLFKSTGVHWFDKGNQITKQLYNSGYFMLAFDLTADHAANTECGNPLNQGTLRIEARFAKSLPQTTTCIVYTEYQSNLRIDKNRNVITSF